MTSDTIADNTDQALFTYGRRADHAMERIAELHQPASHWRCPDGGAVLESDDTAGAQWPCPAVRIATTALDARGARGLTLRQPWASAITHLGKRVENRSWTSCYRGPVALHAGKAAPDAQLLADMETVFGSRLLPSCLPRGGVVAVAELVDVHYATAPACLCSPLWAEPRAYHWVLADVHVLPELVPCRGGLKLWRLPDDLADSLAVAVLSARSCR